MKIPREIEDQFFAGQASDKTKFGINASVSILSGPHKGGQGAVISIVSIQPETKYIVELSNGPEVQINESDMAPL